MLPRATRVKLTAEEKRHKRKLYMREYNKDPKHAKANSEHVKDWRKKNPGTKRGVRKSGSQTYRDVIIDFLIKRDGLKCGFCDESLEGSLLHIDHTIPVALGGQDIMENLRLAHPACNLKQSVAIRKQIHGY